MASITGTAGNDFIHVPGQGGTAPGFNDMPVATDASDTIDGAAGNDRIIGGAGADTITGGLGDDTVDGGAGDDLLLGNPGADTLTGGAGFDTLSYAASAAGVSFTTSLTPGSGGDAQGDIIRQDASIERFIGSAFNDRITADAAVVDGGDGNDVLSSFNFYYQGARTLIGGAGDDTLTDGGSGGATLIGGAGADRLIGYPAGPTTVSYVDSSAGIRINLTGGRDGGNPGIGGDAEGDIFVYIDRAIGSAFDDHLTGNANGNFLQGGAGNDIIAGRGGGDHLDGGTGTDTADFGDSATGVTADLVQGKAGAYTSLTSIENLTGSGHDDVFSGNDGANGLWGFGGDDSLSGGGGTDSLRGGAGQDLLDGGLGADRLDGGDGIDTVTYIRSTLGVTVDLGANIGRFGEAQGDTFAGIENVVGSARGDTLTGNSGANMLSGEDSNDRLTGAGGADMLNGGLGGDFFTYRAVDDSTVGVSGRDTIQDFNSLEWDRIDLSQIDADGNAANGNSTFSFIGTDPFTGAGAEVRFTAAGDDLLVEGDVNGDKVADFAILVQGTAEFTASDFVL
ncbi:hypothetical protein KXS07_24185 [Inquilinus limosus]|uniref:calcium-binding protein n=1 Tax=Inquilinus limosus TaxID=171674 RepID=UPI003F18921E